MQPSDSQRSQLNANLPPANAVGAPGERATIGRSLVIKGEVNGAESLYIDGRIEGTLDFAGHAVTIGANGTVTASISARAVVIRGKVQGNIHCTDRVEICSQGSLTGDVVTQRISVEEGAILKGSVEVCALEQKAGRHEQARAEQSVAVAEKAAATEQSIAVEQPKAAAAAVGSHASFHSVHQTVSPDVAERARTLIRTGYKPKDAVELVLQEIALEYRNDPRIMEKARGDAENFLLKISKGLI